ncbi:MAG: hypothetical protein QOD29_2447 [Alphaproteobacteria bacterium]|nr:hypothetical protein [Alphaproteobacteria bacterium]
MGGAPTRRCPPWTRFFDWLFRSNADKSVYDSFNPIGAAVAPEIDKTERASGFRR